MQIEMKGIDKAFGSNQVLKDAGFVLGDGEVHALMGENGAGRTEIMQAMKYGIGFITEDRKTEGLMLEESIQTNVAFANLDKVSSRNVFLKKKKEAGLVSRAIEELQKPELMGETAVLTALKMISGESVEKSIPVEVELIK